MFIDDHPILAGFITCTSWLALLLLSGCGGSNPGQYDMAATSCSAKGRFIRAKYRTCSPAMITELDHMIRTDVDCVAVFHGSGVAGRCLDVFADDAGGTE